MNMKTLLLAATIGMMSLNVQARDSNIEQYCEAQGQLAESIMKFQQSGKPRKLADTVIASEQGQAMLDWAYGLPREKTVAEQKSSVDAFKEAVYSTCIGSLSPEEKVDGITL